MWSSGDARLQAMSEARSAPNQCGRDPPIRVVRGRSKDRRAATQWREGPAAGSASTNPLTLLERPGAVVTRDELRSRLWPDDTFVDFEHNINTAVSRLRDALGDSAENPRFVETLARRGYRFVAPVSGALDVSTPLEVAGAHPHPARRWW